MGAAGGGQATRAAPVAERPLAPCELTYYDTFGLRLRRHGLMLTRLGDRWQLDRGDGRGCRVETPGVTDVPDELRRLVRAYSRDLELGPVPGPSVSTGHRLGAGPDPTARAVVLGYLEPQVEALARADLAVRLAEPEGVHDLRVATRRIRATLRTFAPVLGGRRLVRNLRESLRWLGASVGPARDMQVQCDRLHRRLDDLPYAAPGRAAADRHFRALTQDAVAECAEALGSHRYLQLLNALEVFDVILREQPRGDQPKVARQPAAAVLPDLVRAVAAETAARVEGVSGDGGPEVVHAVRKSAKRLRYALEAAEEALPFTLSRVVADCRALQDLLGEHQDAVVAGELLRSLSAHAGEPVPGFEAVLRIEADAQRKCIAALPAAWEVVLRGLEPLRAR
ncbi:CHAD domain-containing protein [Amycolatopsis sp. NPDC051903]|uniref:CHAD domain-containing protein n=1 Tax=Amycolatopsis sp. NPDC051903 TaxID=3363936 RepID=UPI0037BD9ADE